jgi:RecA/RadA recombinase
MTPLDLASLPPVRWRVRGVLPFEGIGAIFGPSGSGKSFLTLDMLASVSSGGEWFGCRVKPAPVLYIALEGEAGIAQRVKAYEMKHGAVSPGFRFMLQALDIRNAGDRADLVRAIKAAGWCGGVLCLDTLNRAAPGMDENDSKSMGEVIGAAKAIQAELGGLVLLVHHTGKDATKGMRGHSSLHAALDAAIEVCRDGDRREWKMHKSKDGEDGEAHPFRLEVVEVGSDDEGEPINSCVIMPEENAGDVVRRVKHPKGANARLVWDALNGLFKANGLRRPDGVPDELPIGRPVLSLDEAIEGTKNRLPCDADQRGYRARLAITSLITSDLLTFREGWLWVS